MWSGSRPIRCASCIQHRHKLHRLALISVTYQAILPPIKKQETLLSQMDRATRSVSQNLVNCRNKLYSKSAKNHINGVRGLQLTDL